ncbi:MAG: hypothetical protein ACLQOO_30515 [Terriglobia bacterium]
MSEDRSRRGNSFHRLWQFVQRQIVDDAPEDFAICEFDCRKGQCQQEEWDTCDRRIRKGAGELFPDSRLSRPDPLKTGGADEPSSMP